MTEHQEDHTNEPRDDFAEVEGHMPWAKRDAEKEPADVEAHMPLMKRGAEEPQDVEAHYFRKNPAEQDD